MLLKKISQTHKTFCFLLPPHKIYQSLLIIHDIYQVILANDESVSSPHFQLLFPVIKCLSLFFKILLLIFIFLSLFFLFFVLIPFIVLILKHLSHVIILNFRIDTLINYAPILFCNFRCFIYSSFVSLKLQLGHLHWLFILLMPFLAIYIVEWLFY